MPGDPIARACAIAGILAGRAVRDAIHAMPAEARATPTPSPLKPRMGPLARAVDQVGDTLGIEHLERLSRAIGYRIDLIVDERTGEVRSVGTAAGAEVIFAYMDAVDGTIKVGGLGNDPAQGRFRIANDGGWAAALAFTAPTRAALDQLTIGDFSVAALVDGNPTRYRAYPAEVIALSGDGGPCAIDVTDVALDAGTALPARRVFTSTNTVLNQSMVYLDSFQAFDRNTRLPGDEELAVELYRRLINRHDGGAFDVLRQYANLSALLRTMLGWRDEPVWIESQGGGFVVINENLFNLIPAVPVIAGAGGRCIDFDGRPLAARRLADGRTSIVYAANADLCAALQALVGGARRR